MEPWPTVFVIDDEPEHRRSLARLLSETGFRVETFPSCERFLERSDPGRPGCVVVELRLPGMSGLELLTRLRDQHWPTPVIVLTAYGAVQSAVQALEGGAVAYLEKPFQPEALRQRVSEAVERDAAERLERLERNEVERRLATLTGRERQVLDLTVGGAATKDIARTLRISRRTAEAHRANVKRKMGAESIARLAVLAVRWGIAEAEPGRPQRGRARR